MANIGRLTVDLRLVSQKFEAGIKKANASLGTLRSKTNTAIKSMGGMQSRIAALVGVAGIGIMVNESLKAGDALGKMSDRLGISTEKLSAFQHLAQLSGESIEGFDKSIEKMVRSIGEAQRGVGTGVKAFDELGISLDDLAGKSADEQFLTIADAIKGVEDKTLQATYASDIFGRSGIKLLNTINAGRDGFEAAAEEVDKYGLAISRIDAAKIEAANDAILRAQQVMKGAAMQGTVQLAPLIEAIAEKFVAAGTEGEGFAGAVRDSLTSATKFVGVFADGIRGIHVILKAVEVGVRGFASVWVSVTTFLTNKVLVPFANAVASFILSPLKEALSFAAKYSDAAKDIYEEVKDLGKFEVNTNAEEVTKELSNSFKQAKGELQSLMMETIPSERMKETLDQVFAQAEEKAKAIAAAVNNPETKKTNSNDDSDSSVSEPKGLTTIEKANAALLENTRATLDAIHEERLKADGKEVEIENNRFSRQKEQLEKDLELLEEKNLASAEIREQFRVAEEEATALHNENLAEIERNREAKVMDTYQSLLGVVSSYYDGMEGKQAGYARAAIALASMMMDKEKQESLQSIGTNMYNAAMKAYDAMVGIPYVGPILGGIAAASVLALGGMYMAKVSGLASFEGGGHTGSGARVGGVDGRGGYYAVIHPNEDITDLTKEQPVRAAPMKSRKSEQSIFHVNAGTVIQGNVDKDVMGDLLLRDKRFLRQLSSIIGNPV